MRAVWRRPALRRASAIQVTGCCLSVRAHLLEKAGDRVGAYDHYRRAARATASLAEPRYLESRANRIREPRPEQHQET